VQRGTATDQQRVTVGIGHLQLARPVGQQRETVGVQPPAPRLGVVDRRGLDRSFGGAAQQHRRL
jgi:hypothetical protein